MLEHRVGGFVQSYAYDRNGNLTTNRIGDAFEATTYDGHDRPVFLRTPVGGLVERRFDGNNNIVALQITDPNHGLIFDGSDGVDARNRYTNITRHGTDFDSTAQYLFLTAERKQVMIGADGS